MGEGGKGRGVEGGPSEVCKSPCKVCKSPCGCGGAGYWARWAGWESSGKDMVREIITNYHSLSAQLQSVVVVVSDAQDEREGSEHEFGTQTGIASTPMTPLGIKWVSKQGGCEGGRGTVRLFRISSVAIEGGGIIPLFWGVVVFFIM